jgi:hypothetical protein
VATSLSKASVSVSGAAGGPERASSVRAVLAEHPEGLFVLPSGRRIPIGTLLEHLAETAAESEWVDDGCEVCFAEKIDPWAAPSSAPCWEGMRGPVFHLWTTGTPDMPRKLIGLIIHDQRAAPRTAEIEPLVGGSDAGERLALPANEIELSDLVVEGEYHPRMRETDPAILALSPPAGDGWQGRWWKLGTRPLWQYGWWRWQ